MSGVALDVLAVAPHPDDAELFCGGTLARLVTFGYRVGVVDLTRGELATNGTPETRAAEAQRAAEVLGLCHRENLGLPDGFLDPAGGYGGPGGAGATQVGRLVEALRRLGPELVLAPWRQARHPDHEAASELVRRAVFFAGVGGFETEPLRPRRRPREVLWYPMRVLTAPSLCVDVSEAVEAKRAAIACYASQVGRGAGAAATMVNDPRNVEVILERDRHYGARIGVVAAEPFVRDGDLGVTDPVALLRGQPGAGGALISPERS